MNIDLVIQSVDKQKFSKPNQNNKPEKIQINHVKVYLKRWFFLTDLISKDVGIKHPTLLSLVNIGYSICIT